MGRKEFVMRSQSSIFNDLRGATSALPSVLAVAVPAMIVAFRTPVDRKERASQALRNGTGARTFWRSAGGRSGSQAFLEGLIRSPLANDRRNQMKPRAMRAAALTIKRAPSRLREHSASAVARFERPMRSSCT